MTTLQLHKKNNVLGLNHSPVLCKSAVSGDTKHLRLHVLHRELLLWDRIYFVLWRAMGTGHMTFLYKHLHGSQGDLTSRNDAVDDWRRTSVLCESWNTATRFPLSTATLRHKKLRPRKQTKHFLLSPLNCKDTDGRQLCVALHHWITCRYNCRCWLVLRPHRPTAPPAARWRSGRRPLRWRTPAPGHRDQGEGHANWAGAPAASDIGQRRLIFNKCRTKEEPSSQQLWRAFMTCSWYESSFGKSIEQESPILLVR